MRREHIVNIPRVEFTAETVEEGKRLYLEQVRWLLLETRRWEDAMRKSDNDWINGDSYGRSYHDESSWKNDNSIKSLGKYGDPYFDGFVSNQGMSDFVIKSTKKMMWSNFGNGLYSPGDKMLKFDPSEALEGSIKLVTYRDVGSDRILYYKLEQLVEGGTYNKENSEVKPMQYDVAADRNAYRWETVPEKIAVPLLLKNKELIKEVLEKQKINFFEKLIERMQK